MKRLLRAVGMTISLFGFIPIAHAQTPVIAIEVFPGHGTTLNFRTTGSTVRKAWIDDPSKVTLDFDDAACLNAESDRPCNASVIHLRRIHPLYFPGLPTTITTGLTVVTDRDIYQFRLSFPKSGSPKSPMIDVPSGHSMTASTKKFATPSSDSQALDRGLQAALSQRLITPRDELWHRLEMLLKLLRNGTSTVDATQQVGVSQALLQRLTDTKSKNRRYGSTDLPSP
jgi:hypothetical protein